MLEGRGPREGTMVGTGTIDLECPVDNGQWTRSSRGQCNNPLVASFVLGQYPVVGGLGTRGRRMLNFSKTKYFATTTISFYGP